MISFYDIVNGLRKDLKQIAELMTTVIVSFISSLLACFLGAELFG